MNTEFNDAVKHRFRMKDMVEKTGLSRETIHFYLLEGLLPKPEKTSRNMAWYGEEHVQRLITIKTLQEQYFLPLKAIKAVLTSNVDESFSPEQQMIIDSLKRRYRDQSDDVNGEKLTVADIQVVYGISEEELLQMDAVGAIHLDHRTVPPTLPKDQEKVLSIWQKLRDLGFSEQRGFTPKDLELITHTVSSMFARELQFIRDKLVGFNEEEVVRVVEEAVPLINELFVTLHERKIHEFLIK